MYNPSPALDKMADIPNNIYTRTLMRVMFYTLKTVFYIPLYIAYTLMPKRTSAFVARVTEN